MLRPDPPRIAVRHYCTVGDAVTHAAPTVAAA